MVESPCDSAAIPDGAALSAYQYFENVRNFLVAAQEFGLPTFEASDLEQVGDCNKTGEINQECTMNLQVCCYFVEILIIVREISYLYSLFAHWLVIAVWGVELCPITI